MAGRTKVKLKNLTSVVNKTLEEYADYVSNDVAAKAYEEAAKIAVEELKKTSPRRTGKYAEGWDWKDTSKRGVSSVIVFNEHPQLTHLLENGHRVRKAGKRPKKNRKNFVEARPHIAVAEAKIADNVVNEIKRMLGK